MKNFRKRLIQALLLAAFLLPLALYAGIGLSTRYTADDYQTAGALRTWGFWGAQVYWYRAWSGRFTFTALISLVEGMGVGALPYLTLVCLSLGYLAQAWLLTQLARVNRLQPPLFAGLLGSAALLFATLRGLTVIHQVLYWQTGILTYVASLVFFVFTAGLFARRMLRPEPGKARLVELFFAFLWAFLIGGLSEITVAAQAAALGLTGLFFFLPGGQRLRRAALPILAAGLLGSLASLAVIAMAPGNAVRAMGLPPPAPLFDVARMALANTLIIISRWARSAPLQAAVALGIPFLAALLVDSAPKISTRSLLFILGSSALASFFLILACAAPAAYSLSAEPPDRAMIIPIFFLVLGLAVWGCTLGLAARQVLDRITHPMTKLVPLATGLLLIGLILAGPLYSSVRIATLFAPARERAAAWDRRDAEIRSAVQAGARSLVVDQIKDLTKVGDFYEDPNFLVNRAVAEYYGLDSIIAK